MAHAFAQAKRGGGGRGLLRGRRCGLVTGGLGGAGGRLVVQTGKIDPVKPSSSEHFYSGRDLLHGFLHNNKIHEKKGERRRRALTQKNTNVRANEKRDGNVISATMRLWRRPSAALANLYPLPSHSSNIQQSVGSWFVLRTARLRNGGQRRLWRRRGLVNERMLMFFCGHRLKLSFPEFH
jgi:hypothetical protein